MAARRQHVVLFSALAMVAIGVGAVGGLVQATQSEGGRDWIRRQLERQFVLGIKGRIHLGRLSGSFITDVRFDSLMITDPDDSLFIATGPVAVTYDPRDILDGRIIIRSADIQHPFVVVREENDRVWNFRKVFPVEVEGPRGPPPSRNAFGALVLLHNVRVKGMQFQLTLPWAPDDTLKGARRDSAVTSNLAVAENEIRRVTTKGKTGFQRTWRWTDGNMTFNRIRFRHPDSTGRKFDVARLDVVEHVPPFAFRNLNGGFFWLGDTIWLDIPHFELPSSVARAKGSVRWGTDEPIRYDIRIHSDSTAMSDIAWIYETLPRTGGGKMDLHIHNERDLRVLDYAITNMDVRSQGARLRGGMTFGVGAPVLIVKDVNLDLLPVNFTLLETLNGKPFPYRWKGNITGTLRARGGPVNHFAVDDAKLSLSDGNVPGATTRGTGSGEIDILKPGDAKFHGFRVDVAQLDLRTPRFVNHDFPALLGTVSGTATLDSIWTDLRFRDGDLTHHDGDSLPASRFKGNGRVTLSDNVIFDVAVAAFPLSATTLAHSFPSLPLRGEYSGALRVLGTMNDLSLTADLVGDAGRVQVDGQFDALAPTYRAVANGSVARFDMSKGMRGERWPTSTLNGRFAFDVEGDSIGNAYGTVRLHADRSTIDSMRVYSGQAALRLGDGIARLDSLTVESIAGLLRAEGRIGLTEQQSERLHFNLRVDSLGGFRRYLTTNGAAAQALGAIAELSLADSLDGTMVVDGTVQGSIQKFNVLATAKGSELQLGTTSARALAASADVRSLPDSAAGALSLRLDTLRIGGIAFSQVDAESRLLGGLTARARVSAEMPKGAQLLATFDAARRSDTTEVRLDTLNVKTAGDAWTLRSPASVRLARGDLSVDSLRFAGRTGGRFSMSGTLPLDSAIAFGLQADSIPLADVAELAQLETALSGHASLRADVSGTRSAPNIRLRASAFDAQIASWRLDNVTGTGEYANRRLNTVLEYTRLGVPALHADASLPLDLALRSGVGRFLEEPITGKIRSDTVGLVLLESFSRAITGAKGGMSLNLDLGGTWKHPLLNGLWTVRNGEFGLSVMGDANRLNGIEADIRFAGDSVSIARLTARAGPTRGNSATLTGSVGIRDIENPLFDLSLRTRNFNFVNRSGIDLDLTGQLSVRGPLDGATVSGDSLVVERGRINVAELFQKNVIALDDRDLMRGLDTTAFVDDRIFIQPPVAFVENLTLNNLQVSMGRDVWLRSAEANINLGGALSVTRTRATQGRNAGKAQLALFGALQTVRGTYRLTFGPVQRTFEVTTGEVRYFGDEDVNAPTLNIDALHTVRQFSTSSSRPDVRVRVHIGGTPRNPTAELSSPDSVRVTNADLISYLVTGGPSDEIVGRNADYGSTAARVLVSSFSTYLGGVASGRLLCDDVQLSTAGLDNYGRGLADVSAGLLSGTRFNCAKQVGNNVFVRLDAGLCNLGQLVSAGSASSDPLTFADAIGVKLDFRLRESLTASIGVEPSTRAVLCSSTTNARGFAPTPRQFGVDLFRFWRF